MNYIFPNDYLSSWAKALLHNLNMIIAALLPLPYQSSCSASGNKPIFASFLEQSVGSGGDQSHPCSTEWVTNRQ